MPRPRKISDELVLEALAGLLASRGPDSLTFASASAATGLSGAALVQRYGGRDGMLQAALLWMWDQLDAATAAADARHAVDEGGAVDLLAELSAMNGNDDPSEGLLLLREDFRDPVLRQRGSAWHAALARVLGRRLSPGSVEGEKLGRLMAAQWQGAVLWWGFQRDGSLAEHVRRELRLWLEVLRR